MQDDDPFEAKYRERMSYCRDRASRRQERWDARRERRAQRWAEYRERRSWRYGWVNPTGLWGGERGPSELTLRLRDMMKQVDEITARVSSLEKIATGNDAQLAAEIERLARGPASMGR